MSNRLPAITLASALALAGCDQSPVQVSREVPKLTAWVIWEVNQALVRLEGTPVSNLLKAMGNSATCAIVSSGGPSGNITLFACQSAALPEALVFSNELSTTTDIGEGNELTVIGVHMADGKFLAGTECGILEDNKNEKTKLSPAAHCSDVNAAIDDYLRESDRLLDQALQGGEKL